MAGKDLSRGEMESVMEAIMTGNCTDSQIGAFLVALSIKGEAIEEIAGAAKVMREKATAIAHHAKSVVDTCGTGGDGNIHGTAFINADSSNGILADHLSRRNGGAALIRHRAQYKVRSGNGGSRYCLRQPIRSRARRLIR